MSVCRTSKDREEYNALINGLLERLASFSGSAPSAGGGWRYQLLASWCLMHLIRPTVRPPIAVWHYYTECLSEGDGQPLQRLALGALKRLLLGSADPASAGGRRGFQAAVLEGVPSPIPLGARV